MDSRKCSAHLLAILTVYAGGAFAVIYFAVRLPIRHEIGKKQ